MIEASVSTYERRCYFSKCRSWISLGKLKMPMSIFFSRKWNLKKPMPLFLYKECYCFSLFADTPFLFDMNLLKLRWIFCVSIIIASLLIGWISVLLFWQDDFLSISHLWKVNAVFISHPSMLYSILVFQKLSWQYMRKR